MAKTRKKLSTKKKPCSHRDAMAKASVTWPKIKERLQRKAKREAKKAKKEAAATDTASPPEEVALP